jgi:uncharacterized membrane protein (UPF0127 family)
MPLAALYFFHSPRVHVYRVLAMALLFWALCSQSAWAQSLQQRDLLVQSVGSGTHRFRVEVAVNDAERARGLMFRRELAADAGMLFDFNVTQPVSMWMKNTLLPLDMLFVAEDGRVVNIAERTIPGSLTPIPSEEPVRFVIELAGGTAARLRLRAGDRVTQGLRP